MFKRGLTGDVFGELLETGKAIKKQAGQIGPGKILSTAGKQLGGDKGKAKKPEVGGNGEKTFKEMLKAGDKKEFDPTKVTDEQLKQMKSVDSKKSLENYRKIQQQLLQLYLRRQQKELPAYQAGKAGTARTYEEQKELVEKKRKEEEKNKKEKKGPLGGLLPKSASKMPRLGFFTKQKKGSRETKLGKAG